MTKRLIPIFLLVLLVILHAQMQGKLDAQKDKNAQARLANERLGSEVRDLKEGVEMVEERARMELGMVKPNEIYVQITK